MRRLLPLLLPLLLGLACQPAERQFVFDGDNLLTGYAERRLESRLAKQSIDEYCVVVTSGASLEELYAQGHLPGCAERGLERTVEIRVSARQKGERDVELEVPWQIPEAQRPKDDAALRDAIFDQTRYRHVAAAAWLAADAALRDPQPMPTFMAASERTVLAALQNQGPWIGFIVGFVVLIIGATALAHRAGMRGGGGGGGGTGGPSVHIHIHTGSSSAAHYDDGE